MHIPERMCIGCRKMLPKSGLIRIAAKDGVVLVDKDGKHPGRGAYLCRDIKCIENAEKKKALSKHFKMNVPAEIYESIKEHLYG